MGISGMSQQHPTRRSQDVKIQERIVEHPQIHQVEKVGQKMRRLWMLQKNPVNSPVEVGSFIPWFTGFYTPSQSG